jgi:hypothetical protein
LDDNLAALILHGTVRLELRVPIRWETRPSALRAEMGVHNAHGPPLRLGVQVLIAQPWKLTTYLMIYGQHSSYSHGKCHGRVL